MAAPRTSLSLEPYWAPTRKVTKACKRGHRWTKASTKWVWNRGQPARKCRICHNDWHREDQRRRRLEAR